MRRTQSQGSPAAEKPELGDVMTERPRDDFDHDEKALPELLTPKSEPRQLKERQRLLCGPGVLPRGCGARERDRHDRPHA